MVKFVQYIDLDVLDKAPFTESFVVASLTVDTDFYYLIAEKGGTLDNCTLAYGDIEYPANVRGYSELQVFELMLNFRCYVLKKG